MEQVGGCRWVTDSGRWFGRREQLQADAEAGVALECSPARLLRKG